MAELQALLPVVWAMLSVAPELVGEGGACIAIRSWSGGVQGNPLLPALFCVALHPMLHGAQVRLKEHADWAVVRAQMDDAYLLGPVDVLDEVEGELRRALHGAGMRVDDDKWLTWAAPDVRRRVVAEREEAGLPPWAWGAALVKGAERRFAVAGGRDGEVQEGDWRVCGYGVHIQGVPVGERGFVDGEVRRLVCVAEKKVTLIRDVLVHSKYRHHLHTANVYCFAPLLDHLLRSSFPDDVIGPLARFDAVIKSTAQQALGLQLSDSLVCERSRLPPRRGGLLLRERGGSRAFLPHVAFWGGAASALSAFADQHDEAGALTQVGFLPELAAYVGPDSFGGRCDTPFRRVLQSGGRLGDCLLRSWQRLQVLARVAEVDGYVGLLAADAASVAYAERHLQAKLTSEVEEWRQQRLQSRLDALPVHDRRRESFRAVKNSKSAGAWVMAWPTIDCRLTNEVLSVWAAWWLGEGPGVLRPLLGRELRKDGRVKGVVDEHGVGVTCATLDGSLKTAHDQVKHLLAREGRAAGVAVEVEVFGVFTRALREADVRRLEDYLHTRPGEKQGIIPDLLFDEVHYRELKGIRSDGSHSNYNGAAVTGVEKRAAKWLVELQNKAVRLDREVFGVQQPALGPFQRRLQEIGGIEPLVFGQYGELSESFEGLIDTLAVKGCDQAADHYLLDVGPGAASVQKRLLRQRVNCCVARAQAGVLLRRLKFALPGWAQAEERRRKDERDQAAQRAAQARAYSGEGHSEEWRFEFSRSYPH